MENSSSSTVQNFGAIHKTIFWFLKNNGFHAAAETLRNECEDSGQDILKASNDGLSVVLRPCKCTKDVSNQTDMGPPIRSDETFLLESSYRAVRRVVQGEQTHVIYVCDGESKCDCSRCSASPKPKDKGSATPLTFPSSNTKSVGEEPQREDKSTQDKDDAASTTSPKDEKEMKVLFEETPTKNVSNIYYCQERHDQGDFNRLKDKFYELQDEHQKLIAVTAELTNVLQLNVMDQRKNIHGVLDQCKSLYPTLFVRTTLGEETEAVGATESSITTTTNKKNLTEHYNIAEETRPVTPSASQDEEKAEKVPITSDTVQLVTEAVLEEVHKEHETRNSSCQSGNSMSKNDIDKIVRDILAKHNVVQKMLNEDNEAKHCDVDVEKYKSFAFELDYARLKTDLLRMEDEKKMRILQALRWRITKSDVGPRNETMTAYARCDLLELSSDSHCLPEVFLRDGTAAYVQESVCRLVNAVASMKRGRDYLTADGRLLKRVLMPKLKSVSSDASAALTRDMIVATLQKLSLRKTCRALMVENGLFELLVSLLDEQHDGMSRYCLEYCSALLMNLCLVEAAKKRCTPIARRVVHLTKKLLLLGERADACCLPYVNGIMFSLLENEAVVEEARVQRLDQVIAQLVKVITNDDVKRQLDYISRSRLNGNVKHAKEDADDEDKEEVDLLEAELDENDFVSNRPVGEDLLTEYRLSDANHSTRPSTKEFTRLKRSFRKQPSDRGLFIRSSNPEGAETNQRKRVLTTSHCYWERCHKLEGGSLQSCKCSRCVPLANPYSCSCYDAMRKEILGNETPADLQGHEDGHPIRQRRTTTRSTNDSKETRVDGSCAACGEKTCECAFEPRPRIRRTPPPFEIKQ